MNISEITQDTIPLHPILAFAAMNLFLLILLILIFCSSLSKPAGYEIRMPKALLSEGLQEDQTITITAENVLYFNGKVVTLNELKKNLNNNSFRNQNIFIRADEHSSMGRVTDVWDLCKALGNSHVHILSEKD